MSPFWPIIGLSVAAVGVFSMAYGQPIAAFVAIVLSWPFVLPAAGLGCHKCSYNIFLPYRGPEFSEHGDSWTHHEVERRLWRSRWVVPSTCPKCGAEILKNNSSQQDQNAQTH
jgi:DNA-directed RNA polymerase subunit RPC12/RpoP